MPNNYVWTYQIVTAHLSRRAAARGLCLGDHGDGYLGGYDGSARRGSLPKALAKIPVRTSVRVARATFLGALASRSAPRLLERFLFLYVCLARDHSDIRLNCLRRAGATPQKWHDERV